MLQSTMSVMWAELSRHRDRILVVERLVSAPIAEPFWRRAVMITVNLDFPDQADFPEHVTPLGCL